MKRFIAPFILVGGLVAALIFTQLKKTTTSYEDLHTAIDSLELVIEGDSLGIQDDECCFADTLAVEEEVVE